MHHLSLQSKVGHPNCQKQCPLLMHHALTIKSIFFLVMLVKVDHPNCQNSHVPCLHIMPLLQRFITLVVLIKI